MRNQLTIMVLALSAAFTFIVLLSPTGQSVSVKSRQGTPRTIKYSQPATAPFAFQSMKIAGETIEPNRAFAAADDWVARLELQVENISDKPISYIAVSAFIPGQSADGTPELIEAGVFIFGIRPNSIPSEARIKPGEVAMLTISPCSDCSNNQATEIRLDIAAVFWNDDPEYMFRHSRLMRRTGKNSYTPVPIQSQTSSDGINFKRDANVRFDSVRTYARAILRDGFLSC